MPARILRMKRNCTGDNITVQRKGTVVNMENCSRRFGDDDDLMTGIYDIDSDGEISAVEHIFALEELERDEREAEGDEYNDGIDCDRDCDDEDWECDEDEYDGYGDEDEYDNDDDCDDDDDDEDDDDDDDDEDDDYGDDDDYGGVEPDCIPCTRVPYGYGPENADASVSCSPARQSGAEAGGIREERSERIERLQFVVEHPHLYSDVPAETATLKRCRFLLANQNILALRYVNDEGRVLYGQAANDNFDFPVKFQAEDASPKLLFSQVFHSIARHSAALALDFWKWCFLQFMPYREYLDDCEPRFIVNGCTNIASLNNVELSDCVRYLLQNEEFCREWIASIESLTCDFADMVAWFMQEGANRMASDMLRRMFAVPDIDSSNMEFYVSMIIRCCMDYDDLTCAHSFLEYLVPVIQDCGDMPMKERIPDYVAQIKEHIAYVEETNEKYAYSGGNAWRADCEDGSEYGLDPLAYETERDYNEALELARGGWREKYRNCEQYEDMDPDEFRTEFDFLKEFRARKNRRQRSEAEEKEKRLRAVVEALENGEETEVYIYCAVCVRGVGKPYHYLTDDATIALGDRVIVPMGVNGIECVGTVVSVERHTELTVPYPPDKTKRIIQSLERR